MLTLQSLHMANTLSWPFLWILLTAIVQKPYPPWTPHVDEPTSADNTQSPTSAFNIPPWTTHLHCSWSAPHPSSPNVWQTVPLSLVWLSSAYTRVFPRQPHQACRGAPATYLTTTMITNTLVCFVLNHGSPHQTCHLVYTSQFTSSIHHVHGPDNVLVTLFLTLKPTPYCVVSHQWWILLLHVWLRPRANKRRVKASNFTPFAALAKPTSSTENRTRFCTGLATTTCHWISSL